MIFNQKAFTLVELIIVAVILVILGTLGFSSYASHLVGVRDTSRVSELQRIYGGLTVSITNGKLSNPDDSVEIRASGSLIGYQGYVGESVLNSIHYVSGGKDPRDKTYYSYYLSKSRKKVQLMGFLEENTGLQTGVISFAHADEVDYALRYPTVVGDKLGILTGTGTDLNIPVQRISDIQSAGELDIGTTTTEYVAYITDSNIVTGDKDELITTIPNASCKRILETGSSTGDGRYKITPAGGTGSFQVYCDMTNDGGGWTLVMRGKSGDKLGNLDYSFWDTSDALNITGLSSVGETAKFSDDSINFIRGGNGMYRVKLDGLYSDTRFFGPYIYNHIDGPLADSAPSFSDFGLTADIRNNQYSSNWQGLHDDITHQLYIMTHHEGVGWLVGNGTNHIYPTDAGTPTSSEANFSMWVR